MRDLSHAKNTHWTPTWVNSRWFSFTKYRNDPLVMLHYILLHQLTRILFLLLRFRSRKLYVPIYAMEVELDLDPEQQHIWWWKMVFHEFIIPYKLMLEELAFRAPLFGHHFLLSHDSFLSLVTLVFAIEIWVKENQHELTYVGVQCVFSAWLKSRNVS